MFISIEIFAGLITSPEDDRTINVVVKVDQKGNAIDIISQSHTDLDGTPVDLDFVNEHGKVQILDKMGQGEELFF